MLYKILDFIVYDKLIKKKTNRKMNFRKDKMIYLGGYKIFNKCSCSCF